MPQADEPGIMTGDAIARLRVLLRDGDEEPRATRVLSLEHEYMVYRRGEPVDFRTLIHGLGLPGERVHPIDRHRYLSPTGIALMADGIVAEAGRQVGLIPEVGVGCSHHGPPSRIGRMKNGPSGKLGRESSLKRRDRVPFLRVEEVAAHFEITPIVTSQLGHIRAPSGDALVFPRDPQKSRAPLFR